ncbi:RNA-directed DNA polymerase, eukaryota [Tanacetum coccineum]
MWNLRRIMELHLRGKISVLKATMDMHMHSKQHTVNSAALFHKVLNEMEKLDLEIVDLLEALDAMSKENMPIPARAMILSQKNGLNLCKQKMMLDTELTTLPGNEKATGKYKNEKANAILDMPKHLYEKVVALHLGKLGAKITKLTKDQSYYLSIPILTSLLPTYTDQRGYLLFGKMTSKNLWDCIGSTTMLLSDT